MHLISTCCGMGFALGKVCSWERKPSWLVGVERSRVIAGQEGQ
jgi:hypothetical protein